MNHPRRRPLLRPCCALLVAATLASSSHRAVADNAAAPWIAHAVGQFGGEINALAVDNGADASHPDVVWIGRGQRVEAVSLRDPAAPMVVGRSPWLGGTISALAVDGGLGVAIVLPSDELVALDLRDAARPVMLGRTTLEEWAGDVELAGEFAYAEYWYERTAPDGRTFGRNTVAVVRIGSLVGGPTVPKIVMPDLIRDDVEVEDLRIVGGLLAVTVVADEAPDGGEPVPQLRLYDLVDPASPSLVGSLDDAALSTLGNGPGARNGTRVYGCSQRSGLVAVDVSDPSAPHVVRRWQLSEHMRHTCDRGYEGTLVVDANGSPFGVFGWHTGGVVPLIDAPNVGDPPPMESLPNGPRPAAMVGRAIVIADNAGNITVVDTGVLVRRPGSDARAGSLPGIGAIVGLGRRGDVGDGWLYAMQRYDGLRVLSLDDPRQPTVVERIRSGGVHGVAHLDLKVIGGLAVAAVDPDCPRCIERPVDVFDLRGGGAPRHVGRIADGWRTWLMTQGDAAWAIHGDATWPRAQRSPLAITPIEALSGPPVATFTPNTFTPEHHLLFGAVSGDRFVAIGVHPDMAFARCAWDSVEVWDLGVPAQPRRESRSDLGMCLGYDTAMALDGDVLYVAARLDSSDEADRPLVVFRLQPGGSAQEIGRLPLPGAGSRLTLDDGRLFATTRCPFDASQNCVNVIDVRSPSAPRLEGWLIVGSNGGTAVVRGGHVYVLDDFDGGVWVYAPPPLPPRFDPHRLALPWLARGVSADGVR